MPETQEEWDLISPTHGNSQLEVLLDHFGNSAQSQKFKLVEGDKFHRQVNPVDECSGLCSKTCCGQQN